MAGAVFLAWMLLLAIVSLLSKGFDWSAAIFGVVILFCAVAVGMSISDYYKQKEARLVVESDGVIMRFYISHSGGTSNKSKSIKLENMKRFYLVTKKTRYLIKDKSFEFEPKTGVFKTQVEVFPSLSEIDDAGVAKVMEFVGESAPEIVLGYYGSPLARMFKK